MNQPDNPHTLEVGELIGQLETDPVKGLSKDEAAHRLEICGENVLEEGKPKSILRIFASQFLDPIVYVLIVATGLAFAFGELIEAIAILAVILINALIGFFMEWQAVQSMEALREMAETTATVLRDQKPMEIPSSEVVPGDVLQLEMGDVVPADARLITQENLALKEAALTGESTQVDKITDTLEADVTLADRRNMLYKGTLVTRGAGKAIVTGTGQNTELGKISEMTREAEKEATPLEKKLQHLSIRLIWLTLILAAIIAISGIIQGRDLALMIETAIALAVAAIPEGLPIVATVALARGMLRLARKKVVVKKLQAVQTLGEVGIICTDKTGTLTENKMSVETVVFAAGRLEVREKIGEEEATEAFEKLVKIGILCSNAKPDEEGEELKGDPVEVALLEMAEKQGFDYQKIRTEHPEVQEIPFDTEKKVMGTLNEWEEGHIICVKGALEQVLERSSQVLEASGESRSLTEGDRWQEEADKLAGKGLRILAFAYRLTAQEPKEEDFLQNLTFVGIAGFLDPPRQDVAEAIRHCRDAGIRVVMITGDHPETARNIAAEVGLLDEEDAADTVVHGADLENPEDLPEEKRQKLLKTLVFARVTPSQKLSLISLYQNNKLNVGMTGDGVNDAPALKKADIGIAMGVRGTEAAKEVADIILEDDSFAAIELAIRQGRIIFDNIRKFVVYLLSSNLAEIIVVAVASLANLPLPLLPLQILYLNLVTDVFPALALGMSEGERDVMAHPPRDSQEPIMPKKYWITTVVYGLGITIAVLAITLYAHFVLKLPKEEVNNMAFYTLVLAQLLNVFNLPRRNINFFNNEVTRNAWVWGAILLCVLLTALGYFIPLLRDVLSLVPLSWGQLGAVALFALGSLVITQVVKRLGGTI